MFQRLVSHNEDLRRLVEKGYAVGFDSNCLVVRDVPYLDQNLDLQWGALIAKLEFIDQEHVIQTDHQVYFSGSMPHNLDGSPVKNLGGGETQLPLSDASRDVVVRRSFSNKPRKTGKYHDFFHKIEAYIALISGPAMELHDADPLTFSVAAGAQADPIFTFQDTITSRAEITDLRERFASEVVAVIGLGGTGAFVLDFLVRTPVREIRAFDRDRYCVHNAFRSPGPTVAVELGQSKAEVYSGRYGGFRKGLTIERKYVDSTSAAELDGVTFAFVCVDKGPARAEIFEALMSREIPFIDVGMGLNRRRGPLSGMLRTTYYSKEHQRHLRGMGLSELTEEPEGIYRTNIQISELNALNACLAVIRFKQLRGFYLEEKPFYNLLFEVGDVSLIREWQLDED